jgi:uncharacterized protein YhfF
VALILKENMKHIAIILFLIFISCKNESKTKSETQTETESENVIDKSVSEMWNNYIASNPEFKDEEIPEFDFFHNNKEDAHRLAELTINGKKKASSGLFSLYKKYNVDLPKVGTKKIITNFNGKEKAIIENKSVDTIPFNKISQDYAELDMGTDIEALKKWKKAHWDFFESFLEEIGEQPTEKMLIVCVRFETIWTEK